MNKNNILIMVLSFFLLSGCRENKETRMNIVDISKEYPKKEISIQDMGGEIEYIPLETTNNVLLDNSANIISVSTEKIVMINSLQGDIFIFGRNGKIISYFNHKGQAGEEYIYLRGLVYDEKNKECFVSTYDKIVVYSESGEYKRLLPLPPKVDFTKLADFDDETLLGYDEDDILDNYNTKPYIFISKKDGSIVSTLDFTLPIRYSNKLSVNGPKGETLIYTISFSNNWHCGNDFVISDISSDTIYMLNRDKQLQPLLIRTPSVHNEKIHKYLTCLIKTDKFMYLSKSVVDLEKFKNNNYTDDDGNADLLYNFSDGQIYETQLFNADCSKCRYFLMDVKTSPNTIATLLNAYRIVQQLKENKLGGKLKHVAETLKEDDNQVLMLVKFK